MTPRLQITQRILLSVACLLVITALSVAGYAQTAASDQPQTDPSAETALVKIKERMSSFEYLIEGRPDPFQPFITERAATTAENPDEIIDTGEKLSGMQLFEPGQLTLVALMITESDKFAMVQDFTGKGYVIREGTQIGRRGVVSDIVDNKVIITETAQTRGGKTLTNTIAMVLKKEGEE